MFSIFFNVTKRLGYFALFLFCALAFSQKALAAAPQITVDKLTTNNPVAELSGTVDDPTATILVSINDHGYLGQYQEDGKWILPENTFGALSEGTYDVIVSATNADGEVGTDSTVDELTVDLTNPVITGVEKDFHYNTNVAPTFNEGTAKLNDNNFASGQTISDEGKYDLVVTDAAGNISEVNFEIDKTAPVVTGVLNNQVSTKDLTITFDDGTATLNGEPFTSGSQISGNGIYQLVVSDLAGNSSIYNFAISRTEPGSLVIDSPSIFSNNPDQTIIIKVEEGADFTLKNGDQLLFSGTGTGENQAIELTSLAEGTYNLVLTATDSVGNTATLSINQFTIDLTAPIVEGVANGETYDHAVTINFDDGDATLNGEAFVSGSVVDQNGDYVLVVTDEAGNKTEISFTIAIEGVLPSLSLEAGNINKANEQSFTITGSVENGNQIEITLTQGSISQTQIISINEDGSFSVSFDTSDFEEGTILLTAFAKDNEGRMSEEFSQEIWKDTIPPEISAQIGNINYDNAKGFSFSGQTDPNQKVNIEITDGVNSLYFSAIADENGLFSFENLDLSALKEGDISILISVTDNAVNGMIRSFRVMKLTKVATTDDPVTVTTATTDTTAVTTITTAAADPVTVVSVGNELPKAGMNMNFAYLLCIVLAFNILLLVIDFYTTEAKTK